MKIQKTTYLRIYKNSKNTHYLTDYQPPESLNPTRLLDHRTMYAVKINPNDPDQLNNIDYLTAINNLPKGRKPNPKHTQPHQTQSRVKHSSTTYTQFIRTYSPSPDNPIDQYITTKAIQAPNPHVAIAQLYSLDQKPLVKSANRFIHRQLKELTLKQQLTKVTKPNTYGLWFAHPDNTTKQTSIYLTRYNLPDSIKSTPLCGMHAVDLVANNLPNIATLDYLVAIDRLVVHDQRPNPLKHDHATFADFCLSYYPTTKNDISDVNLAIKTARTRQELTANIANLYQPHNRNNPRPADPNDTQNASLFVGRILSKPKHKKQKRPVIHNYQLDDINVTIKANKYEITIANDNGDEVTYTDTPSDEALASFKRTYGTAPRKEIDLDEFDI